VPELFAGLMSGTSLDGVDGVLVDFSGQGLQVLAHVSAPIPTALQDELLALNRSGPNELHRAALAANALVRIYANVVAELLQRTGLGPEHVRAVGAHGQTVRHQPLAFDGTGYTLQLNNPALLAELGGIDVVADFRSRDLAAGGQGAPLVPAFHQSVFADETQHVAVLNVGGMANLSVLGPRSSAEVLGFDTGPGNVLMDAWCQQHLHQPFDAHGAWAASGTVQPLLLASLLDEPFFALTPPKSTGRDLFHSAWLQAHLQQHESLAGADVQATLAELTARSAAEALVQQGSACRRLVVCGGGALNEHLMGRLQALLPGVEVCSSQALGLPPQQVEATAFAWLARNTVLGRSSSLPKVTGARGARILGAVYPA
jgi:anhydro-N-acetylmuramic acid kinase